MSSAAPTADRAFFGHPRGLSTLFFTEMWERFSYYGMRAFLILFMTASVQKGGLGLNTATAAGIYGTYTAMTWMMSLPGGWLADRLIGQRRAVLYGGILIACGHYALAIPAAGTFYLGLVLIVLGTGLLKPNISVIVGQLYAPQDVRRDAGFSVFYMGINLGAFIGPLITGYLAQDEGFRAWMSSHGLNPNSSWHWGFGAAGVGMTLGLLQYALSTKSLGEAGLHPVPSASPEEGATLRRRATWYFGGGLIILMAFGAAAATGILPVTPVQVADAAGYLLLAVTVFFFAWLFFGADWTPEERGRLYVIGVFFLAAALFWSVYEQGGSTLNLFADRSTRLSIAPSLQGVLHGNSFPSSWLQALNSLFIISLAPVFAWLWFTLGTRGPSSTTKFAIGLMGVGLSFIVLIPAAQMASTGVRVSVLWLTSTYLIQTCAELCLSPVGLSSMTKLAPARIVGLMMGVWFLGNAVGAYIGGRIAAFYESWPLPNLVGAVGLYGIGAGVLLLLFVRPIKRLLLR